MSATGTRDRLALDGGRPVRQRPWPTWLAPGAEPCGSAAAVRAARTGGRAGEQRRRFESEFADRLGVPHALAVADGTIALEIALHAAGIGAGTEVIVPARSTTVAGAVIACGATPVVVDVDLLSRCVTADSISAAISYRTAAVVVAHVDGFPADMEPILDVARAYGLAVLEDCSQGYGAYRDGRRAGTFGDMAIWSFCHDKIMTTAGRGGAVTTTSTVLWERCRKNREHAGDRDTGDGSAAAPGLHGLHDVFATDTRMSEIQAMAGRHQLREVDGWVATRRDHARHFADALGDLDVLRLPSAPGGVGHAFHRYCAHLRLDRLASDWNRQRVVAAVAAEGVPVTHDGPPAIPCERAFATSIRQLPILRRATSLAQTSVTLPLHHRMSASDVDDVVAAVRKVLHKAVR